MQLAHHCFVYVYANDDVYIMCVAEKSKWQKTFSSCDWRRLWTRS